MGASILKFIGLRFKKRSSFSIMKQPVTNIKGLQSKRPQVKTSPSQNVPKLVKTSPKIGQNVPIVKNVGQNVPKMNFYSIFYEILARIWDV